MVIPKVTWPHRTVIPPVSELSTVVTWPMGKSLRTYTYPMSRLFTDWTLLYACTVRDWWGGTRIWVLLQFRAFILPMSCLVTIEARPGSWSPVTGMCILVVPVLLKPLLQFSHTTRQSRWATAWTRRGCSFYVLRPDIWWACLGLWWLEGLN